LEGEASKVKNTHSSYRDSTKTFVTLIFKKLSIFFTPFIY